jgi:hypothetical protein
MTINIDVFGTLMKMGLATILRITKQQGRLGMINMEVFEQ